MTMSSRVLTIAGIVLCVFAVTIPAGALPAAAPVTPSTTTQIHPQQSQPPIESEVDVDPSDLPGDGSESNPYEISNFSELQAMEDDLDANYTLVSDIDASDTAQFNNGSGLDPIGGVDSREGTPPPFTRRLNGNDHTVTRVTIDRQDEDDVGLFGVSSGTLTNLMLANVIVTGNNSLGGLAGRNAGVITNAKVSGNINGSAGVDGLAGINRGGTITDSTALGSVSGIDDVGGLVSTNAGPLTDVKPSGNVKASGDFAAGGLVALHGTGPITNATASGNVTMNGRGVGRRTHRDYQWSSDKHNSIW